jgi:hypothetical protein
MSEHDPQSEPINRQWLPITPAEYHALDAYGSSAIRCFALEGPLEFYAKFVARHKVKDDTPKLRLGRAFHAAMEGDLDWESRYMLIPSVIEGGDVCAAVNATIGKDSKAKRCVHGDPVNLKLPSHRAYMTAHQELAAAAGKDWMTPKDIERVKSQVAAVYDNPDCRELLSIQTDLLSEVACTCEYSGVKRKALIDRVVGDGIVDFKSTCQSNPLEFLRDAKRRGYDYQMGDQLFVTGKRWATIISVNDTYPYEAHAWDMPVNLMVRRIEDARRHTEAIGQLHLLSLIDDKDSQGIPVSYHNDMWGARLKFDFVEMGATL